MNAHYAAQKGYSANTQTVASHRAIEYKAISKITRNLKKTSENMDNNFRSFAEAVHKNNQLWTTLAINVADPDNQLPNQIRAQIFYLAEFSQRHAAQVLAGKSGIAPLIEINTAVLRGLREREGD